MPQSLANVLIHLVFSTKQRRPFLSDPELRDEMHRYLAGIAKNLQCPAIRIGGTEDHVHILARQSRTTTLADWIMELKRASSVWAKTRAQTWDEFQWQAGYGAFSVSQSKASDVERYIAEQEVHHRSQSFQDELRAMLKKHKLEYDERYVWD
jgi:REP element-mobilizing transposase RayT